MGQRQSNAMLEYIYTEAFWYDERCDDGIDRIGIQFGIASPSFAEGVTADGS